MRLLPVAAAALAAAACVSSPDELARFEVQRARDLRVATVMIQDVLGGHGTGFVIDVRRDDAPDSTAHAEWFALIATAGHVLSAIQAPPLPSVQGPWRVRYSQFPGLEEGATSSRFYVHPGLDLGVVEFPLTNSRGSALRLAGRGPRFGERLWSVGFPRAFGPMAHDGIAGELDKYGYYWVTMLLEPGQSGSAVVNQDGEVIAIVVVGSRSNGFSFDAGRAGLLALDAAALAWLDKVRSLSWPRWLTTSEPVVQRRA
jgi:hypothetical protein